MTTTTTTGAGDTSAVHARRAAYDRTAADRAAVDLAKAAPYNLDAVYAAGQAVAIARWLQPYRARLEALIEFDVAHLDKLEEYGHALLFAQTTLARRTDRVRQLPALAAEGYKLRSMLLAYGDLLAIKEVFDAKVIARLREGLGYRDLIEDLLALSDLYKEHPEVIGAGAPVTVEEVRRAAEVASQMLVELGIDQESDLSQEALIEARHKMAHLLITSHRQLRRAMSYLRYDEGDAGTLVPSLHVPPKTRGRPASAEAQQAPQPPHHELAAAHDALHVPMHDPDDPYNNPFSDA